MKTITTHYIDGAFVPSHGREVRDVIRPTDRQPIGQVTLGDEEDTRRAIAAAKRAFTTYGTSKPEERAEVLHRLHQTASARIDDLTAAMVEEYGGVVQFARPIVESSVNAFAAAEKALEQIPWTRRWDKTTVTLEPVGVSGLITAWNANVLFMCLKFASAVAAGCTVVIKPSEMSALQARVLVEALHEAKLPNGLLSGKGADPTGKSRIAFARYNGEAENELLTAGFPAVYIFRPAYILPRRAADGAEFRLPAVARDLSRLSGAVSRPSNPSRRFGTSDGRCRITRSEGPQHIGVREQRYPGHGREALPPHRVRRHRDIVEMDSAILSATSALVGSLVGGVSTLVNRRSELDPFRH